MKLIPSILLLCLSNSVFAAMNPEVIITDTQIKNMGITLSGLEKTTVAAGNHLPARVMIPPSKEYVVSTPQPALIEEQHVAVGDSVKQGQALVRVQSQELIGLQRDYLLSLTKQHLAQNELNRDQQLFKEGIIPERRFITTKSQFAETEAELNARRQSLSLAGVSDVALKTLEKNRKLLGSLEIVAPISGVILESMAVTGQRVNSLEPLYRIGDLSRLWLEMRAPIDRLPSLRLGTPVEIPNTKTTGKIILIGQQVDTNNQTVLVRAEISAGTDTLRVGQFTEVHIDSTVDKGYYRVPAAATVRNGTETVIFVKIPKGFKAYPVQIMTEHDAFAVIHSELTGKEQIAVSGISAIKAKWLGLGGSGASE
jgi:RND family efflux transporter MFP subunit